MVNFSHYAATRYPIKRNTFWDQPYLHNSITAALGDLRRVMTAIAAMPRGRCERDCYGYAREKGALQSCIFHLKEVLGSTKKSSREWSQLSEIIKMVRQASHYSICLDEVTVAWTSLCSFERAFAGVPPARSAPSAPSAQGRGRHRATQRAAGATR